MAEMIVVWSELTTIPSLFLFYLIIFHWFWLQDIYQRKRCRSSKGDFYECLLVGYLQLQWLRCNIKRFKGLLGVKFCFWCMQRVITTIMRITRPFPVQPTICGEKPKEGVVFLKALAWCTMCQNKNQFTCSVHVSSVE